MDPRLVERLSLWHDQIEKLSVVEDDYLSLEANEESLWAELFLNADGKNVADREARAYASVEWRNFQAGLVAAKVAYNREKRILDLKQSAFQAAYLNSKTESEAVQRMPRLMT